MPSKDYNGQNPLAEKRSQSFAQVEMQVGRLQPAISLNSGSLQTPSGRIPSQKRVFAPSEPCQLGKMLVDSANSTAKTTKFKITPGFLTGGGSTELIEPDNLTPTIGNFVWLEIAWTATATYGILDPGGTMGLITVAVGSAINEDNTPTAESLEGTAVIPLGGWVTNNGDPALPVWVKQGCGSIQVYFCPGQGFIFGRGNQIQV